jgi:hypothetical protein
MGERRSIVKCGRIELSLYAEKRPVDRLDIFAPILSTLITSRIGGVLELEEAA